MADEIKDPYADLRSPDFDPWRLITQPGTSHDGGPTRWRQVSDTVAEVTADNDGIRPVVPYVRRTWRVTIEEITESDTREDRS